MLVSCMCSLSVVLCVVLLCMSFSIIILEFSCSFLRYIPFAFLSCFLVCRDVIYFVVNCSNILVLLLSPPSGLSFLMCLVLSIFFVLLLICLFFCIFAWLFCFVYSLCCGSFFVLFGCHCLVVLVLFIFVFCLSFRALRSLYFFLTSLLLCFYFFPADF